MSQERDVVVKKQNSLIISEHQVNMLQMIANDVSRTSIAKKMKLSIRTVEAHTQSIRKMLNKRSTTGAIVELIRKGILK